MSDCSHSDTDNAPDWSAWRMAQPYTEWIPVAERFTRAAQSISTSFEDFAQALREILDRNGWTAFDNLGYDYRRETARERTQMWLYTRRPRRDRPKYVRITTYDGGEPVLKINYGESDE